VKTVTIVMIASAIAIATVLFITAEPGCIKTGAPVSTVQQEQDAIAIAACVQAHWGEDWTALVAHCAAQGFAVFCDAVADIEFAITDKPTAVASAASVAPVSSAAPRTLLATSAPAATPGRKSFYATQPAIQRRLELLKSYR
jgi:hypothetical protein